jgi:oxygen-dependent protoporphyrinogen oxidase
VLVRVFIGGVGRPSDLNQSNDALTQTAAAQLAELVGLSGEPVLAHVSRWPESMPQYHVGHAARMERLKSRVASLGQLALAGNAYQGVGIPQCIASGELAAEEIARTR